MAARLRIIVGALASLIVGFADSATAKSPPGLATEILKLEGTVLPVAPDEYALLNSIVSESRRALPRNLNPQDRGQALAALKAIDAILVRRRFIYDGPGKVKFLHDALKPRVLSDSEYSNALSSGYNDRRRDLLKSDRKGQFHLSDCDTVSYIYVEIGDKLGLPIRLVEAPNHNFVRWEFPDGTHLNFETMDGEERSDAAYINGFGVAPDFSIPPDTIRPGFFMVSLTRDEVMGYVNGLVSSAWGGKGDFAKAKLLAEEAMRLRPTAPNGPNSVAWLHATCTPESCRDPALAVKLAERAVSLYRDPNYLDTLACAYAAAGDFKRAVVVSTEAVKLGGARSYGASLEAITAGRLCSY